MRVLVCAAVAALLVIPAAAAKKPRRLAAADTFSLVGTPVYGGTVQLSGTGENWAAISCYQGSLGVYGRYWFYGDYGDYGVTNAVAENGMFTLTSDLWDPALPASCRALRWTEAPAYTELESFEFTVPPTA